MLTRKYDSGGALGAASEAARSVRGPIHPAGSWMRREQVVTGKPVAVQLWADDRTRGVAAMAAVVAEMQRVERAFNARRADSELALANSAAADAAVRVSDELYTLLLRAIDLARLSGGAFDVVAGAAGASWRAIELDAASRRLRLRDHGVRIDLGAIIDGHAMDRSCAMLARHGVRHAIVRAGGATRTIGDRRGAPWQVAVPDAHRAGNVAAVLPVEDAAVASCESSARGGTDAAALRSATVVGRDALTAAALAHALFVRGLPEALSLVDALPGAAAVLVDAQGVLHATRGLQPLAADGG